MLINKDHLLHQLDGRPEDGWISIKAVKAMIEAEQSIDAVPVVRCEDCLMRGVCRFELGIGLDGFCSQGKRKES